MSSSATLPLCFAEEHVQELKDAFDSFDSDKDGVLTVDEICQVMEQLGLHAFREEISAFVAHFDENGNGVLEFEEFVPVFLAHSGSTSERQETLRQAFSLFDLDGDGKLSASEIRRVLESLGVECSRQDVESFVSQADTQGTGRITFKDFSQILA